MENLCKKHPVSPSHHRFTPSHWHNCNRITMIGTISTSRWLSFHDCKRHVARVRDVVLSSDKNDTKSNRKREPLAKLDGNRRHRRHLRAKWKLFCMHASALTSATSLSPHPLALTTHVTDILLLWVGGCRRSYSSRLLWSSLSSSSSSLSLLSSSSSVVFVRRCCNEASPPQCFLSCPRSHMTRWKLRFRTWGHINVCRARRCRTALS